MQAEIQASPQEPAHSATMGLDELLTPPTVAGLLGVSAPTVYSALQRPRTPLGHLRTPGNQIRIRRREVLAYCHRVGIPVPIGLIQPRPRVVLLHPDASVGRRLTLILDSLCQVDVFADEIEGLIHVGAVAPPQIIVSEQCGDWLIERLCCAVSERDELGYMSVIRLVGRSVPLWNGGVVPFPLEVHEPRDSAHGELRHVVKSLLGLS